MMITGGKQEATSAAEDSDPEDNIDTPPPVPKIKDFKEAVQTLEEVQNLSRVGKEMATKTIDQQSCSLSSSLHNAANNNYWTIWTSWQLWIAINHKAEALSPDLQVGTMLYLQVVSAALQTWHACAE